MLLERTWVLAEETELPYNPGLTPQPQARVPFPQPLAHCLCFTSGGGSWSCAFPPVTPPGVSLSHRSSSTAVPGSRGDHGFQDHLGTLTEWRQEVWAALLTSLLAPDTAPHCSQPLWLF